jgi:hypothetical protein
MVSRLLQFHTSEVKHLGFAEIPGNPAPAPVVMAEESEGRLRRPDNVKNFLTPRVWDHRVEWTIVGQQNVEGRTAQADGLVGLNQTPRGCATTTPSINAPQGPDAQFCREMGDATVANALEALISVDGKNISMCQRKQGLVVFVVARRKPHRFGDRLLGENPICLGGWLRHPHGPEFKGVACRVAARGLVQPTHVWKVPQVAHLKQSSNSAAVLRGPGRRQPEGRQDTTVQVAKDHVESFRHKILEIIL